MFKLTSRTFIATILLLLICVRNISAQDSLLYPSLPPGINAPAFKGKSEGGKTICLEKVKSKYTLLYFYEVHCHLCELVTPQLKKLYDSYRKIGLEVIAIPVESNREEWLAYINEHSLSWKNVFMSGEKRDRLKADYLLSVSPSMYLLDREKNLLTQRMGRIEQVEEELNRRIR